MTDSNMNPVDCQGLIRRRKLDLTRAFAVFCVASVTVWGSAASAVPKPVYGPPSVVFIGDDVSASWGAGQGGPEFAEHPNWINKGVSGQKSDEVLARFQTDVIDLHPEIVHILVGTNDVDPSWSLVPSGANAIDSAANVESMVRMAQANGIHVILATILPWGCNASNCLVAETDDPASSRYERINIWNAWIELYALSQGIPVVDYHSALLAPDGEHYLPNLTIDGVDPSAAGYVVMIPMVENVINAISSFYANK
jgi:lysophospholipase L1-like esterase